MNGTCGPLANPHTVVVEPPWYVESPDVCSSGRVGYALMSRVSSGAQGQAVHRLVHQVHGVLHGQVPKSAFLGASVGFVRLLGTNHLPAFCADLPCVTNENTYNAVDNRGGCCRKGRIMADSVEGPCEPNSSRRRFSAQPDYDDRKFNGAAARSAAEVRDVVLPTLRKKDLQWGRRTSAARG